MHAALSSAPLPMPAHALAEALKAARKRVELEQIALDGMLLALKANGLPTNGLLITPYQLAWRAAKNAEAKLLIGAPKSASEAEPTATEPAAQAAKHRACDERCVKAKTPAKSCSCECNGSNHGKGANATPSADEPAQTELAIVEEARAYSWGLRALRAFADRHRKHRLKIALCDEQGRDEGELDGPEITGAWLRRNLTCGTSPRDTSPASRPMRWRHERGTQGDPVPIAAARPARRDPGLRRPYLTPRRKHGRGPPPHQGGACTRPNRHDRT